MSKGTKRGIPKQPKLDFFPEDPTKIPWNHNGIIVCSGRYYYGQFVMDIPAGRSFPFGGDLMGMLWRYDETPLEWILTMRFRYNAEPNNSPWDFKDRKSWYSGKIPGDEKSVAERFTSGMDFITGITGQHFGTTPPALDWLLIQGDSEKFFLEATRQKKPWMHMQKTEFKEGNHGG